MAGLLDERSGLAGKVALVAGGAGGLGRAVSLDLARAGCALGLCDVDPDALEATAAEIRALPGRSDGATQLELVAEVADVRDPEQLGRVFDAVERTFGRLDVLVNVVGGTFRSPFLDVRAKGRDALVRTNFTWVLDALSRAAPVMAEGGGGSIVTLTSIEAHRAAPGFAVYAAMKAAVEHLTRTLAVELGPSGIRLNCVAPDFVPTEGLGKVAAGAGSGGAAAAAAGTREDPGDTVVLPLGRKGRPEEVSSCVLFLASDLASYVTGSTLHPDGGALAGSGWSYWPGEGHSARPPAWVLDALAEVPGDARPD